VYGLPADFDGAFLVGQTLASVSFTANQAILQFDETVIVIEGAYAYSSDAGALVEGEQPRGPSHLMRFIERPVCSVEGEPGGHVLTLAFGEAGIIRIIEDAVNYECFHIHHAGRHIIV
jgi:hypothetical protein